MGPQYGCFITRAQDPRATALRPTWEQTQLTSRVDVIFGEGTLCKSTRHQFMGNQKRVITFVIWKERGHLGTPTYSISVASKRAPAIELVLSKYLWITWHSCLGALLGRRESRWLPEPRAPLSIKNLHTRGLPGNISSIFKRSTTEASTERMTWPNITSHGRVGAGPPFLTLVDQAFARVCFLCLPRKLCF